MRRQTPEQAAVAFYLIYVGGLVGGVRLSHPCSGFANEPGRRGARGQNALTFLA